MSLKALVSRSFGEHQITIFSGYATKLDTSPFTVTVSDKRNTQRIGCGSEAAARSIANKIWRQLKAGDRNLNTICKEAIKP